jgi:hypothetical protein
VIFVRHFCDFIRHSCAHATMTQPFFDFVRHSCDFVSHFCYFIRHSRDFAPTFLEFAQQFLSSSTSSRMLGSHRCDARETRGAGGSAGGRGDGAVATGGTLDRSGHARGRSLQCLSYSVRRLSATVLVLQCVWIGRYSVHATVQPGSVGWFE